MMIKWNDDDTQSPGHIRFLNGCVKKISQARICAARCLLVDIFELDLFVDLTEAQINNAKINNFVSFLFLVIIDKSNIKEKYLFHKL